MRRTPLYDNHVAAGAKIVAFAGWEMPVQYEGVKAEHVAVRTGVGMFDVSHMGEIETSGPDAEAFLQRILSNDVSKIAPGGAQYSVLCREDGGVLDDLFTYSFGSNRYLTVTNAANHDKDLAWFQQQASEFDVDVDDSADRYAMLAVQGPRAREIVQAISDAPLPPRMTGRAAHAQRSHGARLRHGLHRRGRGRDPLRARPTRRRSGTSSSSAAPRRRASRRATRCASRSAFTSTATT